MKNKVDTIGKRIKELRQNRNMSQTKLGEILSVSNKTISKWENDLSEPSSEVIKVIAKEFNVTVNYLLTGKESNINDSSMSSLEVACKYDDINLIKKIDLSLPDVNGKNVNDYIFKYSSHKVIDYLYQIGYFSSNKSNAVHQGLIVLTGKRNENDNEHLIATASADDKQYIDQRIEKYSSLGYKDLKTYLTLSSNSEPKFDYDRLQFSFVSNEGVEISTFRISCLDDYSSGLLEVKDVIHSVWRKEFIAPNIYKKFLNVLDEINFGSWKGTSYGMPLFNLLVSTKEKFPSIKNLSFVNPNVDDYKRFISALCNLLIDTNIGRPDFSAVTKLINFDMEPHHILGLNLEQSKNVIEQIEKVAPDINVEMSFYYYR